MALNRSPTRPTLSSADFAVFATIALVLGFFYWIVAPLGPYSDEVFHFKQMEMFWSGDYSIHPAMTVIPGYHTLLAALGAALNLKSLAGIRTLNCLLAAGLYLTFFFGLRRLGDGQARVKTLQLLFLPVLLPYAFYVYTDVLSLLLLLLMTLNFLLGRTKTAALFFALCLLVRQSSVVWLSFFVLVVFSEYLQHAFKEGESAEHPLQGIKALLPLAVPSLLFAVFVWWNHGPAVGDRGAHKPGLYSGNIYFCWFLAAVLLAPFGLYRLVSAPRLLLGKKRLVVAALAFALIAVTFSVDHPYNYDIPLFLRNDLLNWFKTPLPHRLLFAGFGSFGALFLLDMDLKYKWPLYIGALASLIPSQLIEHRYTIPFFALFIMLKRPSHWLVEAAYVLWSAGIAAYLLHGLTQGRFFL